MSAFVYREKYRESSHSTHLIKKNKQKTIACIVLSKDIVACIIVHCRSIYQERRVGILLTGLAQPVSSRDLDFEHHMLWCPFLYVSSVS